MYRKVVKSKLSIIYFYLVYVFYLIIYTKVPALWLDYEFNYKHFMRWLNE